MLCYAAGAGNADFIGSDFTKEQSKGMGLVKTRRLAAMQKQQRAKAGMRPPARKDFLRSLPPRPGKNNGRAK